MQGSMKTVWLLIATLVVAAIAVTYTAKAVAAPVGCSDIAYLNASIKATKQSIQGWKASQRDSYGVAISWFKKARYNESRVMPCDYSYIKARRYGISYYDSAIRAQQAWRVGDMDEVDYWMDEVDYYGDLVGIWID